MDRCCRAPRLRCRGKGSEFSKSWSGSSSLLPMDPPPARTGFISMLSRLGVAQHANLKRKGYKTPPARSVPTASGATQARHEAPRRAFKRRDDMNFRKLGTLVLALTIPAIVTSRLAVAQLLYAADDSNQLLAYDAAAGTFTPIGPMPVLIGGMGCADPTSALLYGTDLGSNVGIYSIDSNTATITLLTNVTGHTAVGSTVGPDGNVWAIVTTPTGLLYEVDPFTPTLTD